MLKYKDNMTLEGVVPPSDCEQPYLPKWIKNSTGSFYIGDTDKGKIETFIIGKHRCKIDFESFETYCKKAQKILSKFGDLYKGPRNTLTNSYQYFKSLPEEKRYLYISYTQGDRYLKTSKFDEGVREYKNALVANVAFVKIKMDAAGNYIIYTFVDENWRDNLMGVYSKLETKEMLDIFNSFMGKENKNKTNVDAARLFGIKYAPLIKSNSINVEELVESSAYNLEGVLESLKNGMLLSKDILWEVDEDNQEKIYECPVEYAWYVGATGNNDAGVYTDFSEQYIAEGRWENRYELKYTEVVKSMKVGDKIVIKSSYTKKYGLPFDNQGRIVGVMAIKAIGVITKNYNDGRNIDVDWQKVEPIKEWFGDGVLRTTVHCIMAADSYIKKALLMFTFADEPQDFSIYEGVEDEEIIEKEESRTAQDFPVLNPRNRKKHPMNLILYGAPGTGKTYATAEYALAIIENREVSHEQKTKHERAYLMGKYNNFVKNGRVVFTTFHQSYGYEDFIQGLRPNTDSETMSFSTVDGVFKKIAEKAMLDPENDYVIIIDEINRANISKVFGELITLIEEDKRWGELNAISITLPSGEEFAIPNNLYIVGTMNSADKSISLIDTALRRRFEFVEVTPNYDVIENSDLRTILEALNKGLVDELDSTDLLVGHAYFIGKTMNDLVDIMNRAIIPLLYEYFYDNAKKVKDIVKKAIGNYNYEIVDGKVGRIKLTKKD